MWTLETSPYFILRSTRSAPSFGVANPAGKSYFDSSAYSVAWRGSDETSLLSTCRTMGAKAPVEIASISAGSSPTSGTLRGVSSGVLLPWSLAPWQTLTYTRADWSPVP